MSHLLFWGGRQAGECFFNCTTDYLQFCFRWNILDTRLLLLSCISRVRTSEKSVWLSVSSYLCPIIRPVICHFPNPVRLFFRLSIRLSVRVLFLMSLSIFSQGYNLWFISNILFNFIIFASLIFQNWNGECNYYSTSKPAYKNRKKIVPPPYLVIFYLDDTT